MFATLERAKQYLDITINDYDDVITFYIEASTDIVQNYINRHITLRTTAYSVAGNNKQLLKVNTFPLKTINSVLVDSVDVTSECSIDTDSLLYIYREDGFNRNFTSMPFDLTGYSGSYFTGGSYKKAYPKRDIALNITGGYILPTESLSDFPEDIQTVVLRLVKLIFTNSSIEKSISGENYSGQNYSYSKNYRDEVTPVELSDFDEKVLNKYREVV